MSDIDDPKAMDKDFLMPEQIPDVDAQNFQIEQPGGSFDSRLPQAQNDISKHPNTSQHVINPKNTDMRSEIKGGKEAVGEYDETVLIFGQGPVIAEPDERVNYWSKGLARSAAELDKLNKKFGKKTKFVVLGGKTGGDDNSSEANIIANEMEKNGVSSSAMEREELSNDTIENIVNYLNLFDEGGDINKKVSILCAPFHSARTQVITQLFNVNVENVYQSTELERIVLHLSVGESRSLKESEELYQRLDDITDMVNINEPAKFSSKQSEKEQRLVDDRYVKDDMWTRELLEYPEKWLPYVGKLNNGERIHAILTQFEELYPDQLRDNFGIIVPESFDEATLADVKTRLREISKYQGLPDETVALWKEQNVTVGWPKQTNDRLHKLLNMRNNGI